MRKFIPFFIFATLIILIFIILHDYQLTETLVRDNKMNELNSTMIRLTILTFVFGMLIEWGALRKILTGEWAFNWAIIPSIMMVCLLIIPPTNWYDWFGGGDNGLLRFIQLFTSPYTRAILSVFTGILFIKGLTKRDEYAANHCSRSS